MLIFKILGPMEVVSAAGMEPVRGTLQTSLLRTLLVKAGELVSVETLIHELWGENCPDRVENALQAHISRLRRRLRAMEPEASGTRLVSHLSGYQLHVGDGELDAVAFVRRVESMRAVVATEPQQAIRELRSVLTLWRGPMLGSDEGGALCQAASARYQEYRMLAIELLFEAELRAGNHSFIIMELRDVLSREPFRERFWQQLMVALYRSGRQTEALDAYRELWHRLNDEMGLEPSPATRGFEQAILGHDPVLILPEAESVMASTAVS